MSAYFTPGRLGIMSVTVAWIIWGAHPIAVKYGLQTIPVFSLVFYRLFFATLILLPFLISEMRKTKLNFLKLKELFIASLLGITLNICFYFIGIAKTQAIDASLIIALTPVLNMLAARLILKEKITNHEGVGISLGFVGTIMVLLSPLFQNGFSLNQNFQGNIFVLLAALSWVAFTIYTKRLFKDLSPLLITCGIIFLGMITMFPLMLWDNLGNPGWMLNLNTTSLLSMVYITLASTIAAYFLYEWGLKYIKASEAGILGNVSIVITIILGILILGESLTLIVILGGLLIIGGVVYSNFHDSSRHKKV